MKPGSKGISLTREQVGGTGPWCYLEWSLGEVQSEGPQWETLKTNMDVVDAMIKRKEK